MLTASPKSRPTLHVDEDPWVSYHASLMGNLVRSLLRGEGETSYGLSLDGLEASFISFQPLSGGRSRIEIASKLPAGGWLTVRKDLTFVIRHSRVPLDFQGNLYNYIQAYASEIFQMKSEEKIMVRTDGHRDPDGVAFVHGIMETRYRNVLKDIVEAGIDPRKTSGLVPPSVALHRAVEILEQREFPHFYIILHHGHTGVDIIGVRDGRPVFHRSLPVRLLKPTAPEQSRQLNLFQLIAATVKHIENNAHFGVPQEVVLTGMWPEMPEILDEVAVLFPKSTVRHLNLCDKIVSETLTPETLRTHVMAIGSAVTGIQQEAAARLNFLTEPAEKNVAVKPRDSVYDKIIWGCAAAMLALAFVTANAFFLDATKSRLGKISENQKTIESLRAELHGLEPDLESATRLLNAAAIRLDASKSKTFSIPASAAKLISAIESAAPQGITLDKIESGAAATSQGGYSNLSYQGGSVTVAISGKSNLPEQVIFFQDALREVLGVSVDIATMGREGDFWSRKPVSFVIVLRGAIRRA